MGLIIGFGTLPHRPRRFSVADVLADAISHCGNKASVMDSFGMSKNLIDGNKGVFFGIMALGFLLILGAAIPYFIVLFLVGRFDNPSVMTLAAIPAGVGIGIAAGFIQMLRTVVYTTLIGMQSPSPQAEAPFAGLGGQAADSGSGTGNCLGGTRRPYIARRIIHPPCGPPPSARPRRVIIRVGQIGHHPLRSLPHLDHELFADQAANGVLLWRLSAPWPVTTARIWSSSRARLFNAQRWAN